jgi:cellobiose-specific phosphotransferase system component IIA
MVYIAIKPLGGEQSAANTEMLTKLQTAAAAGSRILMYEAEVSGDTNKLSSILDLAGDAKGALTTVIFDANKERTKQVSITFHKADDTQETSTPETENTSEPAEQTAEPSQAAEIAAETGVTPTAPIGEQTGSNPIGVPKAIKSFDDFVGEAKKNSGQWIKDIDMKKGALRKEMKKGKDEKISPADLAKSEAKLKKKDKDKKKPGLQLDKKDAKTHKRNVLAKNLMKASGAMNESRNEKIKGAKDQLIKIHEIIEKMIKQTSRKK